MFVLRLLKSLDFQPRMALVTRTISGVFADLLHFLALFSIIFLGFTVAGFLLFGHQYQAFSSISNSAQFLVLLLLAFDPTIWIQVCDFDFVLRMGDRASLTLLTWPDGTRCSHVRHIFSLHLVVGLSGFLHPGI